MLTEYEAHELIKDTVKCSIQGFAKKAVSKKSKFQILDLIIPKERKIRSIVGGLETSLGTTLWEPLAKALAESNGFEVVNSNLQSPSNMPSSLSNTLSSIIDERKKGNSLYTAENCHQQIKSVCQSFIERPIDSFEDAPRGRGVDIWLVKDGVNYFFDTKTVQPNLSALTGCMEQVLNWYAYFYSMNPKGEAFSRIVFPYNPAPEKCFWDTVMGGGMPLERDNEGWVGNQFWDFCSGLDNTYEIIENAFIDLRNTKVLESTLDQMLSE